MTVGLDALQTVLLALAVGCGAPALIYLATKGTIRMEKRNQPEENPQFQFEVGQSHVTASVLGFCRIEDSPPMPAKITVYVPIQYADQIAEKLGYVKSKPSQTEQKPAKADEKPTAKPKPIIRRIGVEYEEGEEKGEGKP